MKLAIAAGLAPTTSLLAGDKEPAKRLRAAASVFSEVMATPDAQMHAEILSWSCSQGLFAGLALEGATLREDLDGNAALYGRKLENRDIVTNGRRAPKSAASTMALLNKYSARQR
jgi:lipid-binding SYLF domain-containing protein